MHKLVGTTLLVGIGLSIVTAFVIEPVSLALADGLYSLSAAILLIAGVWGGILLVRSKKCKKDCVDCG